MTIQQVIDSILAYHPDMPGYGEGAADCDGVKCGDAAQECTGIVTSIAPSVDVIRKTIELGANFLYIHEPSFYTHLDPVDWLAGDAVYEAKAKLLRDHNIVIYRDHDHIHAHEPDGIFYGVMRELGWENYLIGDFDFPMDFCIPQTTVRELTLYFKQKMGLNAVRVVGNLDGTVSRISFQAHMFDGGNDDQKRMTQYVREHDIDVIVPLETVDWTVLSYMRDAGQLGMNKALIQVGHMNGEELGCKWAVNWLREITGGELAIQFVRAGDTYQYVM